MFMFALSVTGVCAPTVNADEWNMETKITINHPIEAEGTVLRVGFDVLMLVDLPADRSTVCTLKAVEHNIIATVFANPNLPNCATGQKRVQVLRTEAGQQPALHAWFHSRLDRTRVQKSSWNLHR